MDDQRLSSLISLLKNCNNAIIAFSGGVDSTFLVRVAVLAGIRFIAVTGASETVPAHDIEIVKKIVVEFGVAHRFIDTGELADERFLRNDRERCYYCKEGLFALLKHLADRERFDHILDGSNADDLTDHRPGLRANRKYGVISPLAETGLGKDDIRELSRGLGLRTWDMPSSPCLSSRIVYGCRIDTGMLSMIAASEDLLRGLGFRIVRVRTEGTTASIEVDKQEVERFSSSSIRSKVMEGFRRIGYKDIMIDMEGYRSGKLNSETPDLRTNSCVRIEDIPD